MPQSEKIDLLAAAIVKAQKAMKPVAKTSVNPFFKSKYADLSAVWACLTPFIDNGIAITQSPHPCEVGHIAIETQLTHTSGQWMSSILELPLVKQDPQAAGSAITYARRYALGCMTGLVTEEDTDGNDHRQEDGLTSKEAIPTSLKKMDAQQVQDAPASTLRQPYMLFLSKQQGKRPITEVDDIRLSLARDYYMDRMEQDPKSKYYDEWEEAVIEIDKEVSMRQGSG